MVVFFTTQNYPAMKKSKKQYEPMEKLLSHRQKKSLLVTTGTITCKKVALRIWKTVP